MAGYTKETILTKLKDLKIDCKTYAHASVMTCETHDAAIKELGVSAEGLAKNLFFKAPSGAGKMKNRLFLVSALVDTEVNVKTLSTRLGLKASAPLRFANEKVFAETLQVPLGSVTPFCMANESANEIVMLLDEKFKSSPQLGFHPMTNEATTILNPDQFQVFLDETCSNRVRWVDFNSSDALDVPDVGTAEPAVPAAKKEAKKEPKKKAGKAEEPKKESETTAEESNQANEAPKKKQQAFAEAQYFTLQAWSDGPFKTAHEEWLKKQSA